MKLGELWIGADFIFRGKRYCLVDFDTPEEVIAVKIVYDEPHVNGNLVVSFKRTEEVEYCPRSTDKERKAK